ncbi:hypothetical protein OAG69_00050 [bacterium]|nr:hypothetical protein [bacterium]
MSLQANVKIGEAITISVGGSNMVELIKGCAKVAGFPQKCGHCGSSNLSFMHRAAGDRKQYSYFHLKCNDCGAQCDIGQNQGENVGDVFFKFDPNRGRKESGLPELVDVKDSFYKYWEQPKSGGGGNTSQPSQPSQPSQTQNAEPDNDDEIPF